MRILTSEGRPDLSLFGTSNLGMRRANTMGARIEASKLPERLVLPQVTQRPKLHIGQ
jgi:hypothetical protein